MTVAISFPRNLTNCQEYHFSEKPKHTLKCTVGICITNIRIADFQKSAIQIICYSNARFLLLTGYEKNEQIVWYSDQHSNHRPFDYQTTFDHLNTRLVRYSDPHYIFQMAPQKPNQQLIKICNKMSRIKEV